MLDKNGSVSINTENIFPIIKKWLYSEKDIFIREVVSNSSDAINKLKKLISVGEADIGDDNDFRIDVILNKEEGILKFIDNGIGMTEDEVVKYINQIAFSGAKEFIEKYQGKTDDAQIIGHFGLGFYSSFMVAEKVEIDTLSFQEGAEAVHWESDDGMDFAISPSDRNTRGTVITIHLADDSKEFLDEFKVREVLRKYFSFLPIPLYFDREDKEEPKEESKPEVKAEDKADIETDENGNIEEVKEEKKPEPLNDVSPLWLKTPKDCTDEEYKEFYHKVFMDYNDPLFWIHLNMDYPFNLKGILYFPKLRNEMDNFEGTIKLYYNQVFVADNIKEVIPEFLMLLKGTIDCPDLPLNVSRSFLQNDGYVNKISAHITKKVADKLNGLFTTDKENYCKYWDDINPFVKYGCLKDDKFYDKVKDSIIYKSINGDYVSKDEYLERNKDKFQDKIFYVDDEDQQAQYIKMFKDNGMDAVILKSPIDQHFIQMMEMKDSKIKFCRIDSDVSDSLKSDDSGFTREDMDKLASRLEASFRKASGNEKLIVKVEALKSHVPAVILLSEQSRRMQQMSKMYGGGFGFPMEDEMTLVLNQGNTVVQAISNMQDDESKADEMNLLCAYIYDIAMMAHKPLNATGMTHFIEMSNDIMERLVK
ncbi:MAG: molecular chaperone HtpG [Clostridiales bacterium]|nr:molecular chaperone HtpG [Clostridiales bacterium]